MSIVIPPVQVPLTELHWDQNGYLVQPSDMLSAFWNLIQEINYAQADIFNSTNGVLNGLTLTASSGMQFNVANGRARALGGLKIVQLVTPGAAGQPSAFNTGTGVINGTGMSAGQTRVDSVYLQYSQVINQNVNTADIITDNTTIFVSAGIPGTPGNPNPILVDNSYVLIADVTVHYNDTVASQATISYARVTELNNLVSLTNSFNALGAVLLNPVSQQTGSINISGSASLGSFVDAPAIVTPAAPAASHYRRYFKSDGNEYVYDPVYGEQLNIPVGIPFASPSSSLPAGTLWQDGDPISRTTYARLFGLWGTTYGIGDGATTFNKMDLRGRGLVGQDNYGVGAAGRLNSNGSAGASSGHETHTNTTGELVSHAHTDSGHIHIHNVHTHTDSGHNHLQNAHNHSDAGHGHGASDSGHGHSYTDPGHTHPENVYIHNGSPLDTDWSGSTDTAGLGKLTTDSSLVGITISTGNAVISIATGNASISSSTPTNQSGTAAISTVTSSENSATANIGNTGSSTAWNIMNPYQCTFGWIVRY